MHRMLIVAGVAALTALTLPLAGRAAITGLTRVASGLSSPIYATHAPGDRNRLFIVERGTAVAGNNENSTANIKILNLSTGLVETTPFLSITGLDIGGEGGLLGMAFHPNYSSNGKFYVYVTANDSVVSTPFSSYIREYTVSANPNVANTSFTPIIEWTQPQSNHNGGWIGFSPNDNYLYIASGDGGGSNDTGTGHTAGTGNAQDTTSNLLGKMLRIDVNGDDFPGTTPDALARNYAIPSTNPFKAGVGAPGDDVGDDEIWSFGLRNPFRASFDRIEGDLWIGDVGQDNREEINFQAAASTGAENYGWRLREGDIATPTGGVGGTPPANHAAPIYSYTHPDTTVGPVSGPDFRGSLVTGGYVYRGPDPSLQGRYFFLDASSSNHWMVNTEPSFGTVANIDSLLTPNTGSASFAVSFGEDAVGNLYIVYNGSGEVYRIATNEVLPGDYNSDGMVDESDLERFRQLFGTTGVSLAADGNRDGVVNAADYIIVRKNLGASVHAGAGAGTNVPEPAAAVSLVVGLLAFGWNAPRQRRQLV